MATAAVGLPDINLAPEFIRFLFSTKPKFDCYFKVGNDSHGKPERIGGVKLMLMAHSEVFRLELEESELKEKEDVPIKDIHPDTFKGMLKYVYGHDTTKEMCFDEADNLFYVAEKYMMKTLKDKLALRLMDLLNPDNICSLLNNPACHTHLELNSAITEILRYETDYVLASQQFLCMDINGFFKILEQDGLAVTEIELWRAATKWAKHQANSEDDPNLRQHLSGLKPHFRFCTLTVDEVRTEVAPTEVLTGEEIDAVCQSVEKKEKLEGNSGLSDETKPREKLLKQSTLYISGLYDRITETSNTFNCTLTTKENMIELLPLECQARDYGNMPEDRWVYRVECTTTITKVGNTNNPWISLNEPPITVTFSGKAKCGRNTFKVPLVNDGRNVALLPKSKYKLEIKLSGAHNVDFREVKKSSSCRNACCIDKGVGKYENDHLTLELAKVSCRFEQGYRFPTGCLRYRVVTTAK